MTTINYGKLTLCPFGVQTTVGSAFCVDTKHGCGECYEHNDRKHIVICTHKDISKSVTKEKS